MKVKTQIEQVMSILNTDGHEIPDSKPMSVPVGFRRPETLKEQIRAIVQNEVSRAAEMSGMESFEESDDFDVGDEDEDLSSPYQLSDEMERQGRFVEEEPKPMKKEPAEKTAEMPAEKPVKALESQTS